MPALPPTPSARTKIVVATLGGALGLGLLTGVVAAIAATQDRETAVSTDRAGADTTSAAPALPRSPSATPPAPRKATAPAKVVRSVPAPVSPPATPNESLPPGDPGDVPGVSEPPAPTGGPERKPARRIVPAEALLDAAALADALGDTWTSTAVPTAACDTAVPATTVGRRSAAHAQGDSGRELVETVATHASAEAANTAVASTAAALASCGWTRAAPADTPPIGEASAQLTRTGPGGDRQTALVLSSEGVTVSLVGRGGLGADKDQWFILADTALGSSCPAAADGCH